MVCAKNNKIRSSVQKIGLVAALIRKEMVSKAIVNLDFSKKRIASEVKKVLLSAIANAQHNHNLEIDSLYVAEVIVGRATALKRMRPRARGRGNRINKYYSNIKIVLGEVG